MAPPRDPPKTKGGFVHWGEFMHEMAPLTEPQMRAFECLMRDAPQTTTRRARLGKATSIRDHQVVLNSGAVRTLEKHGLVHALPRGTAECSWWEVLPTERGKLAWKNRSQWVRR